MASNEVLASYATFKALYNSENYKNPYQILSEFIRYSLVTHHMGNFSLIELQDKMEEDHGFKPMISVMMKSLTDISGISFIGRGESCRANLRTIKQNANFCSIQNESKSESTKITECLLAYAKENGVEIESKKLTNAFIDYVLDQNESKLTQLISQFIVENEKDNELTITIDSIREGSLLYSGLAFHLDDIQEVDEPLTLYLDTEILFDVMGLNGSLCKILADDLISLVDNANKKGKVITLRYFSEVKKDLEGYFLSAERIVEKNEIILDEAMKEIVSGCDNVADVAEKKVRFFRKLHQDFAIREDEKENYDSSEDTLYSLEEPIIQFPITDKTNYEAILFCSKINKLRKGFQTQNYLKSRFLCVTRTSKVLEVSKYFEHKNVENGEKYCGYALGLSHTTNLLWARLNKGFGKTDFPKNLDIVIKAKMLLSAYLTQNIKDIFDDAKEKRQNNQITENEILSVAAELRTRRSRPEDLSSDNIREQLALSERNVDRVSEERANDKRTIRERDEEIQKLKEEVKKLNSSLIDANARDQKYSRQINELTEWQSRVERKENLKKAKTLLFSCWVKLIWAIIWKLAIIAVAVVIVWIVCKKLGVDFAGWAGLGVGVISLFWKGSKLFAKDIELFKKTKLEVAKLRGERISGDHS